MSDTQALAISDFTNKATGDLQNGLNEHNLQLFMTDIDTMKHQVPAGQYSDFMKALNTSIDVKGILPPGESIIGPDATGKNLLVANEDTQRALKVSNLGQPLQTMSEKDASAGVPQHMVKLPDLTLGDGKFSMLLPPGLDTTGTGKFQVKDLQDQKVVNKDGTITHNVQGELNDAESKMNIHVYTSEDDASFKGNYTTTADGNLLNSHIQYDSKTNFRPILGGTMADIPLLDQNPSTPFRELPGNTFSPSVDTVYSAARGAYITQIDTEPNSQTSTPQRYETTPVNGKEQVQALSNGYINRSSFPDNSSISRDAAGNIYAITVNNGTIDNSTTTTTVKRDQNGSPTSLIQSDGASWNKIADNRWQETTANGQKSTFNGEVIVEDSGDIDFSSAGQTVVHPFGSEANSETINAKGQMVAEDLGQGVSSTFKYAANGKVASETDTEVSSDSTKTTVTHPQSAEDVTPIKFF